MTNKILVGVVFLVGCAVGGASSAFVVPKASAQQAATLTKFEHFCWKGEWNEMPQVLAKATGEGWELTSHTHMVSVDYTGATSCFKRPKM